MRRRGHTAIVDALLNAGADGTAKDNDGKSPADLAKQAKHPMIVAKCDPALAKAEGEKLRKAFAEATTVHVLSTRFNEPSEEVLAAWYKANGIKKMKEVENEETVICGWSATRTTRRAKYRNAPIQSMRPRRQSSSSRRARRSSWHDKPIVTVEPGTLVFDPNTDNASMMDGDSNNANAIWLRNWREVGLENAMKTGGWCIQVLVQGGPSEMQRAEESMARSEGVPVIKLHLDKEEVINASHNGMGPYLKALFEAMKTKPKAEKRTIDYYPEAVVLTKVDVERMEAERERKLSSKGKPRWTLRSPRSTRMAMAFSHARRRSHTLQRRALQGSEPAGPAALQSGANRRSWPTSCSIGSTPTRTGSSRRRNFVLLSSQWKRKE